MDRNSDVSESNLKYETSISYLSWRYGANEDWKNYENFLNNYNWIDETRNMDINDKLKYFYETLEKAIENVFNNTTKKNGSKRKIPKKIKIKPDRKTKLSKKLINTKNLKVMKTSKDEFIKLKGLKLSYEKYRYKCELEVMEKLF